jgi:glucosamine 6-phosphate synthetase-like amidotransferase/phosphosugar isomerase protein
LRQLEYRGDDSAGIPTVNREGLSCLREELQAEGVVFLSDTDTEVIPQAVEWASKWRAAAS